MVFLSERAAVSKAYVYLVNALDGNYNPLHKNTLTLQINIPRWLSEIKQNETKTNIAINGWDESIIILCNTSKNLEIHFNTSYILIIMSFKRLIYRLIMN